MSLRFSIVTPSFNQGKFLQQTMQSVLSQQVPELEYVVIDGGSTDGSREIIASHGDRLAHWCSEPDDGQYQAINKGFARTTGDIMGWLNSSDVYFPWTLPTVLEIFEKYPEVQWVTSLRKVCVRENGAMDGMQEVRAFGARAFFEGRHGGPGNRNFLQQEATFWRRELWEKIGGNIPVSHGSAGDFFLWGLFFQHAPVAGVDFPLAGFRIHESAKNRESVYDSEVQDLLARWKSEGVLAASRRGYLRVTRHWEDTGDGFRRGAWKLENIAGDELLWLPEGFERGVIAAVLRGYCMCCNVWFRALSAMYFLIRLLLWPIRKKAPWDYKE